MNNIQMELCDEPDCLSQVQPPKLKEETDLVNLTHDGTDILNKVERLNSLADSKTRRL